MKENCKENKIDSKGDGYDFRHDSERQLQEQSTFVLLA